MTVIGGWKGGGCLLAEAASDVTDGIDPRRRLLHQCLVLQRRVWCRLCVVGIGQVVHVQSVSIRGVLLVMLVMLGMLGMLVVLGMLGWQLCGYRGVVELVELLVHVLCTATECRRSIMVMVMLVRIVIVVIKVVVVAPWRLEG